MLLRMQVQHELNVIQSGAGAAAGGDVRRFRAEARILRAEAQRVRARVGHNKETVITGFQPRSAIYISD